jgi:hypothetical protein
MRLMFYRMKVTHFHLNNKNTFNAIKLRISEHVTMCNILVHKNVCFYLNRYHQITKTISNVILTNLR